MRHVPPSEAVRVLERFFPFLVNATADPALDVSSTQKLASVLAILDAVPGELITVDSEPFARFIEARATIRTFIDASHVQGVHARPLAGNQVRTLRDVLARCPDHAVPATVATLAFI